MGAHETKPESTSSTRSASVESLSTETVHPFEARLKVRPLQHRSKVQDTESKVQQPSPSVWSLEEQRDTRCGHGVDRWRDCLTAASGLYTSVDRSTSRSMRINELLGEAWKEGHS